MAGKAREEPVTCRLLNSTSGYLPIHVRLLHRQGKDVRKHEAHSSTMACRRPNAVPSVAYFAGQFDWLTILHVHVVYNVEAHPSCDIH